MPHTRNRLAFAKLLKRLKYSPIVAIQGARQTGKSVLANQLLAQVIDLQKVTFDQAGPLRLCNDSPETFLAGFEPHRLLVIDEAQKAPGLFDALKYTVDRDRRPGRFLLLGSTEFSHLQNIRETLTGRMTRVRLYPLVYRELSGQYAGELKLTRADMLKYLETGGMPAIAFSRDIEVRNQLLEDWIQLTCQRDIHQLKRHRFDSELAYSIFKAVSTLPEPTLAEICRMTGQHSRKVENHLIALSELFCVIRLSPHPTGRGKPIYLPFDSGVAAYFGASRVRKLQTILLNERMAHNQYLGNKLASFYYYRSTGKNQIHLIEESPDGELCAYQILEREGVRKTDFNLLLAFGEKNPKSKLHLFAPVTERLGAGKVLILPWEKICL